MQLWVFALGWATASYVIYKYVSSILAERRYLAEMEKRGCKLPLMQTSTLPWSVDRVYESLKADRRKAFPNIAQKRFQNAGNKTYTWKIMGSRGFFTADPKLVQAVLATQFNDFCLGYTRRGCFMPLLGNGIFTADGKAWEHSRAMLRPQFARDQISDLSLEEKHVQNLMRALPVDETGWTKQVDMQVLFFRYKIDTGCEFLFGESVDSQIANLPENASKSPTGSGVTDENLFAISFDRSQAFTATRSRLMDLYWLYSPKEYKDSNKSVHDFVDYFVHKALKGDFQREKELEKGHDKDRYVFLEQLVSETRDPIELRSQLLNILLAARDTTASLLGYLFWILARNPEVFQKLRANIVENFGSYGNPGEISFVTLKNCQLLQHCINETLRLYPVVPVNSRRAQRDTVLPSGGGPDGKSPMFIKKDMQVDYSVFVMHRRKDIWGEDAEEFRPGRWVGRKPGWEYLPFNGGPRICLGREFPECLPDLSLFNYSYPLKIPMKL